MKAVIYTSNTGTTKEYAEMFAKNTGLPVYPLNKSAVIVEKGADIIYFGWIMAGIVKGYKKASKLYNIRAVCGVGMSLGGSQVEDVRKTNSISDTPVFTLQGGYCKDKLRGIYKFMLGMVEKSAIKELTQKTDKTDVEKDMLELMKEHGSRVSAENLKPVMDWYNSGVGVV